MLLSSHFTRTLPSALPGWNGYAGIAQLDTPGTTGVDVAHNAVPKSIALDKVTSVRWKITPTPSENRSVTAQAPETVKSTVLTSDLMAL